MMFRPLASLLLLALLAAASPAAAQEVGAAKDAERAPRFGREWVWLDAGFGYQHLDMTTFSADPRALSAGLFPTEVDGPVLDLGGGLRIRPITLGPRLRWAGFPAPEWEMESYRMWSIDGELGVRIPLGRVEPHLAFAAGYTGFDGIDNAAAMLGDAVDLRGANVRGGIGLDVFVTRYLTLGGDASIEALTLTRPGVAVTEVLSEEEIDSLGETKARLLEAEATSTGSALTLLAGLGLHF